MGFNYEYPYTDAHRFNNDWLLNTVKNLAADWVKTRAEWNETAEEFAQLKAYVSGFFDKLDLQEEVNKKLDIMASDGTLSALIRPLFEVYKTDINNIVDNQNRDIAALSARMDTFSSLDGSVTAGDAEIIDARIDRNGNVHGNVGTHIRDVSTQLSGETASVELELLENELECTPTTISGKSNLWITDALNAEMIVNPISGVIVTSKNMLPRAEDADYSGVTFRVNADNSVTLNGTASNDTTLGFGTLSFPIGEYVASTGAVDVQIVVGGIGTSENGVLQFKKTAAANHFVGIAVKGGQTFVNKTVYPMVEYGTEPTTYEPRIVIDKAPYRSFVGVTRVYSDTVTDITVTYAQNAKNYISEKIGQSKLIGRRESLSDTSLVTNVPFNGYLGSYIYSMNGINEAVHDIGVKYILVKMDWHNIEQQKKIYNFTYLDEYVNAILDIGCVPMFSLTGNNPLYASERNLGVIGEENINGYRDVCGAIAKRYKDKGAIYLVWNEPNSWIYWYGVNAESPKQYMEMLKAAYPAIKAQDASATVITCNIVNNATTPIEWFKTAVEHDLLSYSDMIGLHYYGAEPEAMCDFIDKIRNCMIDINYNFPIALTEIGYSIAPDYIGNEPFVINDELRSKYLPRAIFTAMSKRLKKCLIFQIMTSQANSYNKEDWFGIFNPNFEDSLTSIEIKRIVSELRGFNFVGMHETSTEDYCLEFRNKSGDTKLVSWTTGAAKHRMVNDSILLFDSGITITEV